MCLASCSEDEPARMNWEVSASPKENVKAVFDPTFYKQIQITANGEVGEVILKCTNYRNLNIYSQPATPLRYVANRNNPFRFNVSYMNVYINKRSPGIIAESFALSVKN